MPTRLIIARVTPDVWRWVGYQSADTGLAKGTIVAQELEAWLDAPGEVSTGRVGPTITTSVRLGEDLHARLTVAAAERGVSAAEVVRAAVGAAMERSDTQ